MVSVSRCYMKCHIQNTYKRQNHNQPVIPSKHEGQPLSVLLRTVPVRCCRSCRVYSVRFPSVTGRLEPVSGPEGAFFFRFFVRLEKMVREFLTATLGVVIIQPILRSAGLYYHQLGHGWHFQTRPLKRDEVKVFILSRPLPC